MRTRAQLLACWLVVVVAAAVASAQGRATLPPSPTPTDLRPGSITCDECPYPYPSKYLDINVYSQDVRIAYMDVAPRAAANGHTVLLLHGNNFGGFYFKTIIDGLTNEGFRVIATDQIGYGRSSKLPLFTPPSRNDATELPLFTSSRPVYRLSKFRVPDSLL